MELVEVLRKVQNQIKWDEIPFNEELILDEKILEEFRHKFNWKILSQSTTVLWTEELIERYFLLWDFKFLSANVSLPWSFKLLRQFAKYWDLEGLKNNDIVLEMTKISPLGADIVFASLGIFDRSNTNSNKYHGSLLNRIRSPRTNWHEKDDTYCGACMMSPCHCSDPDPG